MRTWMGGKVQSGFAAVRDGTLIAPTLQLTLGNAPGVVLLHSLAGSLFVAGGHRPTDADRGDSYASKKALYDMLFRTSAETLRTIAADPKRPGAEMGFISLLRTWVTVWSLDLPYKGTSRQTSFDLWLLARDIAGRAERREVRHS
jgi:hypothetical protein